jgi:hypothetical protein
MPSMPAWLPTLLVIIASAVALTAASSQPASAAGRRLWVASICLFGSLAIAGTVWQGRKEVGETVALAGTSNPPQRSQAESDGRALADLTNQVKTLRERVRELEKGRHFRAIPQGTAGEFADYLKQFGSRRVVVSYITDDLEAYQYANQLVNLLKAANWDAQGPEATKIFGDVQSPGINVYVNPDDHSGTAKILLDGFAKFNIPYQPRVTPSHAIPDSVTVELFIGAKRSERVDASAD